ncbi:putative dsRNA-binding protein, partial [Sulfuricurvum sp.]|uniref:putative dsRNA-binding protein n=1 Tax=Sulfuricurvum sp. TaxID=2025608 RepID=UPI003BB4DCFE
AIKCNIYLSSHSVMKNNIQNIFFELLGVLCWHLEFKKFNEIFNDYFDYTNEYVYDEYKSFDNKTLLQELSQQKYGLPKYIQISENGPDHKKVFEFNVEINSEVLGRGTGDSKKNAQENAAENAVHNFIKKYSYIEKKVIKDYKLHPYDLTEKRKNQLKELNILLPKEISNLYMLDIAFSHISIIHFEPFSRSNDSLSFLGSFIENLSRTIAMLHSLKDFEDKSFNKYIAMLNKAHVGVILENYFDTMNFQYFLKSNLPNNSIPISVKLSCVESLLALYFLEYGLEFTESYIREIWKDFKTDDLYVDYTNLLQEYIQNPKIGLSSNSIVYIVLNESGKDHNKTFEIGCYIENILYGKGIATNKKEAKRIASHETYKNSNFIEKYPLKILKK